MNQDPTKSASTPKDKRYIPLAAKLSLSTVLVLGLASVVVVHELSTQERERLVHTKLASAERTAELFVAYDAVSLAFADEQGVRDDLATLQATPEVTYAAVWTPERKEPVAELGQSLTAIEKPALHASSRATEDYVRVVRPVRSPEGEVLGVALVQMSLAKENAAFTQARQRIIGFTGLLAAVIGLLIALIVRFTVVQPLGVLARAARRLEHGERVRVGMQANDEVGVLSKTFDTMTQAIVDREDELLATTGRLQGLLDHIGQAIVIFGRDGNIEPERSKQAVTLVGSASQCPSVVEVLFPEGRSTPVEREAFRAWAKLVFEAPPDEWDDLIELAPTESVVPDSGGERIYELTFRPLIEGNAVERVMLLATDVTDERALRRRVANQDEEHARSIAMMRRLVAGGGQVFVRFLEQARYRVRTSLELVERIAQAGDGEELHAREELFRQVHTLRGEVRCFDLDAVEGELSSVEFGLSDLRSRTGEGYDAGQACRGFAERLQRVREGLDRAEALFVEQSPIGQAILDQVTVRRSVVDDLVAMGTHGNSELRSLTERLAARPFGEVVFFVIEAVPRWLTREHKKAQLDVAGRTTPIPGGLSRVLTGVLPHLVRNAIAHGIEDPVTREEQGKPAIATLSMGCEAHARGIRVVVRDDGAGFDMDALRERAQALGVTGTDDPYEMAFAHGVSTRDDANEGAGHGVGLDAVRRDLGAVGYRLRIESERGRGTAIWIEPERED